MELAGASLPDEPDASPSAVVEPESPPIEVAELAVVESVADAPVVVDVEVAEPVVLDNPGVVAEAVDVLEPQEIEPEKIEPEETEPQATDEPALDAAEAPVVDAEHGTPADDDAGHDEAGHHDAGDHDAGHEVTDEHAAVGDVGAPIPGPGEPRVVHRPRIVSVVVTVVGPDRVEVKLADGRLGAIPVADFGTGRAPSVGDELDAALLARSDPKRVWLSRSWAVKVQAWERLAEAKDEKRMVPATVLRLVKGGAVADVEGQRAFLPTSLADDHQIDLATLVGTIVDVTVIDLDEGADRVVVSRRDVLRRQRRAEQREVLGALAVGQRATGTVVGLRDFGVQVDLGGGIRGLVHRTELSWNRIGSIRELVKVGDQVEAVVTEVQRGKRRVSLSMRQTTPDPMLAVEVGAVSQAEITRIVEYGAFARLEDSAIEGLIHQTELSELPGARADELVAPGDVVWVKVIDIDVPRRRLALSVRQALLS